MQKVFYFSKVDKKRNNNNRIYNSYSIININIDQSLNFRNIATRKSFKNSFYFCYFKIFIIEIANNVDNT